MRPRALVAGHGYFLIAGRHRLEAARKLKWQTIRAEVRDIKDDAALLAEIDENLVRADLSLVERCLHIDKRKALYERLHPETKHGGDRRSKSSRQVGDLNDRFTKDTAKTGLSERSVQRDVARAKAIVVLPEITRTSLDTGAELDALAKLPESEQRKLAKRAKAGEKVSAKHHVKKFRRADAS